MIGKCLGINKCIFFFWTQNVSFVEVIDGKMRRSIIQLDVYKEEKFIKEAALSVEQEGCVIDIRAEWPYNAQLYLAECKPLVPIDWSGIPVRVYMRLGCEQLFSYKYAAMNMTQKLPILQCVMCERDSVFADTSYLESFCSHACYREFIVEMK